MRGGVARARAMAAATSRLVSTWRPSPLAWPARWAMASASAVAPSASRPRSMRAAGRVDPERLEAEEGGAAEQRRVDLEEGVLGGGADEGDEPALDAGEEGVLLRLVEAVDLVEEEDRALAPLAEAVAGPLERVADVLHAGAHRAELLEGLAGVGGDGLGQGRLAGARRPPQDHRRQPVALDEGPQGLARPEQLVLADDVVEGAGPQARGEGRVSGQRLLRGGGEEVVGHGRRPYPTHPGRRTPQHITVPFSPSPSTSPDLCPSTTGMRLPADTDLGTSRGGRTWQSSWSAPSTSWPVPSTAC